MKIITGAAILTLVVAGSSAQNFYDITRVNTIELLFAEPDWDRILDSLYAAGQDERLMGTAFVNGVRFDSVGVRYKGQSSYHPDRIKNPLNIRLDYLIQDQLADDRYGSLKLSSVYKDPSFVREVLSYEIARKYMAASQANYADLYINGNLIGLYTNDQDVDKFFTRTHFYSDEHARFKGILGQNPRPVVWGYFGTDSTSYFDYYELEAGAGWSDLIRFLDTLNNNTGAVESVFDVDRHLWMLAFDLLTVNLDSPLNTAQNYYLYEDGGGRFNPIVWDFNENFGAYRMVSGRLLNLIQLQRLDPLLNLNNPSYPVVGRILSDPTYQKMFVAHMKTLIAENFANGWYLTRATEIQSIIDPHVQADRNKFYTYNDFRNNLNSTVGSGAQAIVGISELMEARRAFLATHAAFQGTPPAVANIFHTPARVHPNTTVWFTAGVTGADLVMLGCRQSTTGKFTKTQMYDDGGHNDGSAGDGIYGAAVTVGAGDMNYYVYAENSASAAFSPERAEFEYFQLPLTGGRFIALERNFPNPFRHSTTITYNLPDRSRVTLKIYDVAGRVVDVLVDEIKDAGSYQVGFAPRRDGRAFAAGIYLLRLAMQPVGGNTPIAYDGTVKLVMIR